MARPKNKKPSNKKDDVDPTPTTPPASSSIDPTEPAEVAKKEPITKRIPSKLVTIKQIHDRRIETRARQATKMSREARKKVDELNERIGVATDDLRDFLDQEYLRTGRDPETLERGERDPEDVIEHHRLEKVLTKVARKSNRESSIKLEDLENEDAITNSREAEDRKADWLNKFCLHFECAEHDIDWDKCELKIHEHPEEVPEDLMTVPED